MIDPTIVAIFQIVAPHIFRYIEQLREDQPDITYAEALAQAGIRLDAEYMRLLSDMAKDIADGAVPKQ